MKNAFKKFTLLSICSLFALLGCAKQNGSLVIVGDSSKNIDHSFVDDHPAFTEYEKLEILIGHQELLKDVDIRSGACFSSRSEFISYANQVNNQNHEFDKFAENLKDEDFDNKKLIFTAQITLRAGNEYLVFNKMYLDNNDLHVLIDLHRGGDEGTADIRYAVYTFFINKDLSYNSVITVLNNYTEYDYRIQL